MTIRLILRLLEVASMLLEKILGSEMHLAYEKYTWTLGPCQLDILESCDSDHIQFYLYTSAAYLDRGKYNVIVVDWGRLVRLPCYPTAVINTWQAGRCTAELLDYLGRSHMKTLQLSKLHIIGFSLGAHVAAFASNHIFAKFKKRIGRITGLDPALPFFASLKSSWKLDKPDAKFVDIIHTNSGIFGKIEATGHADFYVNGGTVQPACKGAHNPPLCSHVIATIYFAESILASGNNHTAKFRGLACPTYFDVALGRCKDADIDVVMGETCSTKTRGIFYVKTGNRPPFAKG